MLRAHTTWTVDKASVNTRVVALHSASNARAAGSSSVAAADSMRTRCCDTAGEGECLSSQTRLLHVAQGWLRSFIAHAKSASATAVQSSYSVRELVCWPPLTHGVNDKAEREAGEGGSGTCNSQFTHFRHGVASTVRKDALVAHGHATGEAVLRQRASAGSVGRHSAGRCDAEGHASRWQWRGSSSCSTSRHHSCAQQQQNTQTRLSTRKEPTKMQWKSR